MFCAISSLACLIPWGTVSQAPKNAAPSKRLPASKKRVTRLIPSSAHLLSQLLRSAQTSEALKNCTDTTGSLRSAIMIELEVYAQGLRDLNKILELDLQLEPIAGLHYKIDTNHDLVYFEFDRPTLSMREIRAIFLKLGLEPLFVGAIPPELRPRTKTEPLTA